MSKHLLATLQRLATDDTTVQAGWHFGSLKALVSRGLAETFKSTQGTEYRVTDFGRKVARS
jgi:hypothetical protein